jgi:hypothetical protein
LSELYPLIFLLYSFAEITQLVMSLAWQPSGAWSTQPRNRQASAQALPGDCLEDLKVIFLSGSAAG